MSAMSGSEVKTSSTSSKTPFKSTASAKMMDGARKQAGSPVDGQNKKQQAPQPRAWQGPNPITARGSTSTPNGTDKSVPKPQSSPQTQQKSMTAANADKHAHDRILYLLANCTGLDATVTLKNGEQFSGIFSGGSFEVSKPQYVLKMVKQTRPAAHLQVNGNVETEQEYIGEGEDHMMAFDREDTVDVHVADVNLTTAQPVQNGSISTGFRTDTQISARDRLMGRERELQRWDGGGEALEDMSLGSSGGANWDQFAANERMYGVQSSYNENIYTTEINRSDPQYRRREAEAARIAAEIEGSAPANAHVAEERRTDAVGEGLDEEEKYSGVQRDASALPKRAAGSYIPPSQRAITTAPTVPGAPYDPAIISLEKPVASGQAEKTVEPAKTPELTQGQKTPQTEPPVRDSARLSIQNAQAPRLNPPTQPIQGTESTTEDHVRNVTDSFKQFANNEKLRIRQAQEAKRSTARAEKTVKLNDLKKFAANFKLKSKVPDDLVPILAKDREKQLEIQDKAEKAYHDEEQRRLDREKAKAAGNISPTLSSSTSQPGTAVSLPQQSAAKPRATPRGPPLTESMASPGRGPGATSNRAFGGRPGFPPPPQPLPANLRMPGAPPPITTDNGPLSPTKSLNAGAKAFEFRPGANAFTPTGTSPSPHRSVGTASTPSTEKADFFKDKKAADPKRRNNLEEGFNPLRKEYSEEQKKANAANGGIPNPYRTPPTWPTAEANTNISWREAIPKPTEPGHVHHHMHTPNSSQGHMPHAHQLPPHMQGPQPPTPSNRPPFMPPHHGHPQGYGQGMPQFPPNGSVQNSPRFQAPQMAYGAQMPPMQMPQYGGQAGYQMSPNMQYRQMSMPPNGPMMMMPHQGPGQMQMPQGYPRQGGPQPYGNPQQMMVPPGNNGAPPNYMQGMPMMPGQQQPHPSYSPMPQHVTPHMHPAGPYGGSPRPGHMMQHAASHQGFNPNGQHMGPGGPGMQMGMGMPPMAPSPHPHYLQQRHMSGGQIQGQYPQMTPRQGHAMPHPTQPSPGVGGDEGK